MEGKSRLLTTRSGFALAYWQTLEEAEAKGLKKSNRDTYEELEAQRFALIGSRCFPSFDAFRKYRDRKQK